MEEEIEKDRDGRNLGQKSGVMPVMGIPVLCGNARRVHASP